MATIGYRFSDGRYENVEVTDGVKAAYEEYNRYERRVYERERRHTVSLDVLLESEGKAAVGAGSGVGNILQKDLAALASTDGDPLEILIAEEELSKMQNNPLLNISALTDYQKRIAVEYYVHKKSQTEIAGELKISKQSLNRLIRKIRKKIAAAFS